MVKQEILEGLKESVARGETLKSAMMAFYNAGYKKEDIEEAARALMMQTGGQAKNVQKAQTTSQPKQKSTSSTQQVSEYSEQKKPSSGKKVKIILSSVIGVLVVIFIALIIFRNPVINFLNGLFN